MAVMTYKELKKRGLDHGEKWLGCVFSTIFCEDTLIIKIDLDHKNEFGLYNAKECYIINETSRRERDFVRIYDNIPSVNIDFPDSVIFGNSLEEMVEYVKTAPILCPVKNTLVYGYKLLKCDRNNEYALCILEIPPDAKRTNPYFGRKCRADKAMVKVIWKLNKDGNLVEKISKGYSPLYYPRKEYSIGEVIYPDSYDESRLHECTNGIHFYSTIGEVLELHKHIVEKTCKEVLYYA